MVGPGRTQEHDLVLVDTRAVVPARTSLAVRITLTGTTLLRIAYQLRRWAVGSDRTLDTRSAVVHIANRKPCVSGTVGRIGTPIHVSVEVSYTGAAEVHPSIAHVDGTHERPMHARPSVQGVSSLVPAAKQPSAEMQQKFGFFVVEHPAARTNTSTNPLIEPSLPATSLRDLYPLTLVRDERLVQIMNARVERSSRCPSPDPDRERRRGSDLIENEKIDRDVCFCLTGIACVQLRDTRSKRSCSRKNDRAIESARRARVRASRRGFASASRPRDPRAEKRA